MSTPLGASRDIRRYFSAQTAAATKPIPAAIVSTPADLRRTSSAGSADDEDPLLGGVARLRLPELRPGRSRSTDPSVPAPGDSPSTGSRIAVVLTASPRPRPVSAGTKRNRNGDAGDASSRSKPGRPMKETPVPIPMIPGWNRPATSSKAVSTPTSTTSAANPINKRGRPKGWKAGMSYAELRGNPPPGSRPRQARVKVTAPVLGKRRGRPPKPQSPPPIELYRQSRADFAAFLCEWAGCRAELHNLDTLRKHVYVVHGRQERQTCRWRRCGDSVPAREFLSGADFRRHVEQDHLIPLAWHVGDGPQNDNYASRVKPGTKDKDEVPDYLKDTEGNQVTPSIRDQEMEDLATWRANRRKLKELLMRRDENLPDEDSESPAEEP